MIRLKQLTIKKGSTIKKALSILNTNQKGICFVIDSRFKLLGVLTDGDLRRAIMRGKVISDLIDDVMNINFVSLHINSSDKLIRKTFTKNIKFIPLVNDTGKLLDVADLKKSHYIPVLEPSLKGNELKYIQDCIDSNWISSNGSYVEQFESLFSKLHNNQEALAVSNGTVALQLALLSLGIGKGDEVIVPDITFAATINAVLNCNATPVICEINPKTWCIDEKEAKKLISSKTKAIIPVHLYGQVCDMKKITILAKFYNLLIIEDCAEALGSTYFGKPVGINVDASTFSFFGNKTISTGEGGMVVFKDPRIAEKAKIIRAHGMSPNKKYWHEVVGHNFRLTNLQAAIGVAQLERFSKIIKKKLIIAKLYSKKLSNFRFINKIPFQKKNIIHSNWLYTIILDKKVNRDKIILMMRENGIDCRPVFHPLHLMPPYKDFKRSKSLKNSLHISSSGISLPSSVNLTNYDISYIIRALKKTLIDYAIDN